MRLKILTVFLALILSAGCSAIQYGDEIPPVTDKTQEEEKPSFARENIPDKYKQKKFDLTTKEFFWEYSPDSPVSLESGSFKVEVDLTAPQHYRIGIKASSVSAAVSVSAGEQVFGTFYISHTDDYDEFFMDGIYLPTGKTELVFTILRGTLRIKNVNVENSAAIPTERYKTAPKLSVPAPSEEVAATYSYLVSCFGSRTLSAQYCTINTNTEINAVKAATGREPAIRCGDLAKYSRCYGGSDKADNREIELALDWNLNKRGIVFLTWSWYAPDGGGYYSQDTSFNLGGAVTKTDLSLMSPEQVESLAEAGEIPAAAAALVRDIDDMAANLGILKKQGVPVLFAPLPDGGSKLYWWGDSIGNNGKGSDYIWLWRLMFERMSYYHVLDNLIWVWNGSEYDYYPGDDCVDIIGESIYNRDFYGSEAVRFAYTSEYNLGSGGSGRLTASKKLAAVTGSGGLPSPDVLGRDNVRWLFWALYRGDFLIDGYGEVVGNAAPMLDRFYNHEGVITLDEMPDVNHFGIL